MLESSSDKIKFAPIKEVDYKKPVSKSKNYTLINDIQPLEWYCHNDSETGYQHIISNKTDGGRGLFRVMKKSMETRVETQTLYFTDFIQACVDLFNYCILRLWVVSIKASN